MTEYRNFVALTRYSGWALRVVNDLDYWYGRMSK